MEFIYFIFIIVYSCIYLALTIYCFKFFVVNLFIFSNPLLYFRVNSFQMICTVKYLQKDVLRLSHAILTRENIVNYLNKLAFISLDHLKQWFANYVMCTFLGDVKIFF